VERVLDFLPDFDLILVMTVNPGFSGQGFLGENLEKVRAIRRRERENAGGNRPRSALDVQVDGGIDTTTAPLARDAGANVFVAASAIFGQKSPGRALQALRASIDAVGAGV
jgi:ribulose-phosphate 3-epimerase